MPPKVKVTKEAIVDIGLELVRRQGPDALNARSIASALGCSTQPIFSNFSSMEQLHLAVAEAGEKLFSQFMSREIARGCYPPYKASGMAYIRFAREERSLFRLLYMRDRSKEAVSEESDLLTQMETMIRGDTGLDSDTAKLLHLEMWIFVHGIAVMIATGYLEPDEELISRMLTDSYQGLRKQFIKE